MYDETTPFTAREILTTSKPFSETLNSGSFVGMGGVSDGGVTGAIIPAETAGESGAVVPRGLGNALFDVDLGPLP